MKTLYPIAAALALILAASQATAAPTSGSNPLSNHVGKCIVAYTRNDGGLPMGVLRSVSETHVEIEWRWEGQNYPLMIYSPSLVIVDPQGTCLVSETGVATAPFNGLLSKPRD